MTYKNRYDILQSGMCKLYRKDDLLLAMTYYMEELFDVSEMFGALQLCERVCDKCHIRRHIASRFEKHRSDITKDTTWYNGTVSNLFFVTNSS